MSLPLSVMTSSASSERTLPPFPHRMGPECAEAPTLPRGPSNSTTLPDLERAAGNFANSDDEEGSSGSESEKQKAVEDESNVVGWDGPNDPENPHNWSLSRKYAVTIIYSMQTFCFTFASSVFSTATEATAQEYGVSSEVMTLGTSLFIVVRVTTVGAFDFWL